MKSKATEHRHVEDRLSAYLDGELSPREMEAVEQHLAACQECQCCLDNLRQTVEWTRALPKVPLPRTFVIPAPAWAVRAPQRRRNLLPVLQGATALVALLLVFAVAGDALLTGFLPAAAPEPAAMKESALQVAEVTQEVGLIVETPAAEVDRSAVTERSVVEATEIEATAAPSAAESLPAEKAMVGAPSPTEQPQIGAMTAPPGMGGGEEAPVLEAVPPPEVAAAEAITVGTYAAAEEPTEAVPEALAAAPAPASVAPTAEALAVEAPDIAAAAPAAGETLPAAEEALPIGRGKESARPPFAGWLRLAEVVFGIAFIVLGTLTIAAMIRRRRIG